MLDRVRLFLEMIRFSHTVFALPFAILCALLAWQATPFRWTDLAGIILCMVSARTAAMGFNRLVDRDLDRANPRTAGRHLPRGLLTPLAVVVFTAAAAVLFVGATAIFLLSGNRWPLLLSVPVLLFVGAYSYTKRLTALSHFWLGASLMLAPLATWIAIRGMEGLSTPICLGLAVLFWVAGFDILYACQDVEFDRRAKLKSIPALLGIRPALRVAAGCHFVMVSLLVVLGIIEPSLGAIYLAGVALVAALLVFEHWIVRPEDLTRVNRAFFHVNGVISIGLLLVTALQLSVK
jgi:4-hydroxybenzoate polyprenyltransferase